MSQATDLLNRIHRQKEETAALKEFFFELFPPEFMVADSQFGVWLRRYGFEIVEEPNPIYCKTRLDVVKYASGVMVKKKATEGNNG